MGRYYSINFGLGNAFEGLFEDICLLQNKSAD